MIKLSYSLILGIVFLSPINVVLVPELVLYSRFVIKKDMRILEII